MTDKRIELANIKDELLGENAESKALVERVLVYSNSIILSAVESACINSDMSKKDKVLLVSVIIDRINKDIYPLLELLDDAFVGAQFNGSSFARGCGAINMDDEIIIDGEERAEGVRLSVSIGKSDNAVPDELKELFETMMTQPPAKA